MRTRADFEVTEDYGTWLVWDAVTQGYICNNITWRVLRFDTKEQAEQHIEQVELLI